LSYTRFTYANLQVAAPVVPVDGRIEVAVDVTNAGSRAGSEIVQLYVGFPHARVDRPVKLLRGFDKVALGAGETTTVRFAVRVADLAYWDAVAKAWSVERVPHDILVGGSSRTADLLRASVEVVDAVPSIQTARPLPGAVRPGPAAR
jgi:beta-glucosidase